jgi:hypothetical protein
MSDYAFYEKVKKALSCATCPRKVSAVADFEFDIPETKLLDNIVVESATGQTINIGTTPAGTQIAAASVISAGVPRVYSVALFGGMIYVTGVTGPIEVRFYLR